MGFRIVPHPEAFANAPARGQKRPRQHDKNHLAWLSSLPCVITGKRPVDVAHIRFADAGYGKRLTGSAEKPDDKWCVPLHRSLHDEQHSGSEKLFWLRYGIDPLKIALALHSCSGDDDQAFVILNEAWAVVRTARLWSASQNPDIREGE